MLRRLRKRDNAPLWQKAAGMMPLCLRIKSLQRSNARFQPSSSTNVPSIRRFIDISLPQRKHFGMSFSGTVISGAVRPAASTDSPFSANSYPCALIMRRTVSMTSGQHFSHMAVLLTFSDPSGQHFSHTALLLTFSAISGQHFSHTALLLTFSVPSGQHLRHMAALLTFSDPPVSICAIWLLC